jgi:hypothetical protein
MERDIPLDEVSETILRPKGNFSWKNWLYFRNVCHFLSDWTIDLPCFYWQSSMVGIAFLASVLAYFALLAYSTFICLFLSVATGKKFFKCFYSLGSCISYFRDTGYLFCRSKETNWKVN